MLTSSTTTWGGGHWYKRGRTAPWPSTKSPGEYREGGPRDPTGCGLVEKRAGGDELETLKRRLDL